MMSILLEINYKLPNLTHKKFCLPKFIFPKFIFESLIAQWSTAVKHKEPQSIQLFYVQVTKHLHGKD